MVAFQVLVCEGSSPPPELCVKLIEAGGGTALREPFTDGTAAAAVSFKQREVSKQRGQASTATCYAVVPADSGRSRAACTMIRAVAAAAAPPGKATTAIPCVTADFVVDTLSDEVAPDVERYAVEEAAARVKRRRR